MKHFFKAVSAVVILGIAVIITFTTWQFNSYSPHRLDQKPVPGNLKYFQNSYDECRSKFLEDAQKLTGIYKNIKIAGLKIETRQDHDLSIDYCYIPAQKTTRRLLIISSGVHGVEGYAGSAVQQMILTELAEKLNFDELGLLLIHGLNPYGFKYNRRVNENNVDLNRNCSTDSHLFETANPGYDRLNMFLNPRHRVNLTSFNNFFFQLTAARKIMKYSISSLRQAILQGQYQYPRGIYFGGSRLEPSILAVTSLIRTTAQPYPQILSIDLHTGYGANGQLYLFPNPVKDRKKKARIEKIFSGQPINWGDTENFYIVTGEFATYIGSILPNKDYMTMTFEFGTMDTDTTMGSIKALHNVIIENQGNWHGYASRKDKDRTKERFIKGYYPESEKWRSIIIEQARKTLIRAIKAYQTI